MAQKEELAKILGAEKVFDDPETLEVYSRDQSFAAPGRPWYVVKPGNTEEVQKIIKWANENSVPLTPVSSPDGPRFHGDTIPFQGGIVVDLGKMNKVLRVDRRDKVAMIEPGVTFDQLESELRKNGLRAFKPLLPRRTKSVLASYLEREPIVVPKDHWDATDPLICTEVVFGTGDIFRTGSAAGPGTVDEQLKAGMTQVNPSGPGLTSLSRVIQGAQGTMGIVTWATVVCGLLPEDQKAFFVLSDTLEPLIDLTYKLLRYRIGEELFLLNSFSLANIMAEGSEEIGKLSAELPPWVLFLNLTGHEFFPEERIEYQEKDTRDLAQGFGLELVSSVGGISGTGLRRMLEKPPEQYYKLKFKGGCQDIIFLTTLDRTPSFITEVYRELEAYRYPAKELGVYFQPIVQGCACHCEFCLMYDPANAAEKEGIKTLLMEASPNLAHFGAFFSRPYWPWADIAYRMDAETTSALRKVKGIFDPRGIMNPGKLCF